MTFATASARLTDAVKNRLGEAVQFAPPDGAFKTVQAVVNRDVQLIGHNGQVTDRRTTVGFARTDVGAGLEQARVQLAGEDPRVITGVIEDDGQMVTVFLQ